MTPSPRRVALIIAAAGLLLAAAVTGWFGWQRYQWSAAGPAPAEITVFVEPGSSLTAAARALEKSGVIASTTRFLRLARRFGGDRSIQAGEYAFPAHASMAEVLDLMQQGRVLLHKVTLVEGMSALQLYERLLAEPLLTGDVAIPGEGTLLPDTYTFSRGESRAAVLARMQSAMEATLAELWGRRAPGLPFATPREAVTLASIVEKETSKKEELTEVAGVYINRLRLGMKLQADPTVIYPITRGKPLGRRIRLSELRADNDYNTYVITGLPAGPIANPSRRSLAAVLNPAKTDNLYFVADGSGGHVFAPDLDTHNRNVARWRQFRAEQGI